MNDDLLRINDENVAHGPNEVKIFNGFSYISYNYG